MDELVRAYRAMAATHESNTMSMQARDQAEGGNGRHRAALAAMHPQSVQRLVADRVRT